MGPQEILAIYFLVALLTVIFNRIEERIRRYNIMGIFTVLGLGVVLVALPFLQEGVYKPLSSSELPPSEFKVDTLSRTLALIFTAIGLSAALYSLPYIREERRAAYYTLYLLLMAGLTGALFSNDLFTFFLLLGAGCCFCVFSCGLQMVVLGAG
ncbi:MAG: hypothetical protein QXE91_02280 [Thermofilaceae archaeon]